MFEKVLGQNMAVSLLRKLIVENFQGRTIIFFGNKGTGKFFTSIELSRFILKNNPFLSTHFQFYRNDDFSLKTRFFIDYAQLNAENSYKAIDYFFYLMSRISASIALGESISKNKFFDDTLNQLEHILINGRLIEFLKNDRDGIIKNLLQISDELSKKKKIPIDFIRNMIGFHSQKAVSKYKISIIGEFENATVESQNAALKLLEEPPASGIIILTTSNLKYILPTIISRSVIIKFNPLSPANLTKILGDNPFYFNNTIDLMENAIYNYKEKQKIKVKDFFDKIALNVQYENKLFLFIDELTSQESNLLSIKFLEEMIEYFRNLNLLRQQYLRNVELKQFISPEYLNIENNIIENTYASDLKNFIKTLSEALTKIKYGNITDKTILPAILIDIARWHQKIRK